MLPISNLRCHADVRTWQPYVRTFPIHSGLEVTRWKNAATHRSDSFVRINKVDESSCLSCALLHIYIWNGRACIVKISFTIYYRSEYAAVAGTKLDRIIKSEVCSTKGATIWLKYYVRPGCYMCTLTLHMTTWLPPCPPICAYRTKMANSVVESLKSARLNQRERTQSNFLIMGQLESRFDVVYL